MIDIKCAIRVEVDLRHSLPPVRDQGDRPTCLACATSDAHSIAHGCPPLSAEFLLYQAIQLAKTGNLVDGILFEEAAEALAQKGQPAETEWPYPLVQPDPWVVPTITKVWKGELEHSGDSAVSSIARLLKADTPVVLGLKLSAAFLSPLSPPYIISPHGAGFGGHAVLAIGLGSGSAATQYFLIRNSWGDEWGDAGHAWLAAEYLADKHIGYAPVVAR